LKENKEKPLLSSTTSTSSLNKIQHLMDKLNQKIAIRVLKKKISNKKFLGYESKWITKTNGKSVIDCWWWQKYYFKQVRKFFEKKNSFFSDELEESLFTKKVKQNYSNRKKIIK